MLKSRCFQWLGGIVCKLVIIRGFYIVLLKKKIVITFLILIPYYNVLLIYGVGGIGKHIEGLLNNIVYYCT